MYPRSAAAVGRIFLVGLGVCLPAGCGTRPVVVQEKDPALNHLVEIVAAYSRASQQLGRPPQKLDEIKLHFLNPADADGFLRSPNDGEPYAIVWGVDILNAPAGDGPPLLLVYEKKGSGGKRRVATVWRTTQILTDDAFGQARFPKGHQPPRS